jgi:circadian clock protein KaiC
MLKGCKAAFVNPNNDNVRRRLMPQPATVEVRLVVIDSLSGYLSAMPEERFLSTHVHELLTYLSYRNVVTLLTLAQHGVMGDNVASPVDLSYLADTVLLLRYFEAHGAIRRALSVVKKRSGPHETSIREMLIRAPDGIVIGEPLTRFQGVLSGRPTYAGEEPSLADLRPHVGDRSA